MPNLPTPLLASLPVRLTPGLVPLLLLLLLALFGLPARAGLPELVAAAKPAVVAVGTYDPLASPRFAFRGTGFVVTDGRTLVTNAHVVPEETAALGQLVLLVSSKRGAGSPGPGPGPSPGQDSAPDIRPLKLLQLDRTHDLALLQFGGEPLPVMTLDSTDGTREGQALAFIGFPIGGLLGFSPVTHRATVSSITPIALPTPTARQLDAAAVARLRQGSFDILQLDGTAYPGNSGGPLFDIDNGQVVGVINMVLAKTSKESLLSNPSGITYAIPVRYVRELLGRR